MLKSSLISQIGDKCADVPRLVPRRASVRGSETHTKIGVISCELKTEKYAQNERLQLYVKKIGELEENRKLKAKLEKK